MARARDELWEQYRKTMTPSVHDLKAPWPRGHPIQSLVPFKVKGPCNIPYVESRVRNLVFTDPHVFLTPWSNDKDEKEAIGPYIDNWKTALEFYVEAGPVADRRNRIRLAWDHATGPLSESRMSLTEAYRFWSPTFALLDVKTKDLPTSYRQCPQRDLSCPRMPRPDDPSDPIEWNPESVFASHPERIEERELSLTYLDIMLDDMEDKAPCGEEFRRKSSTPAIEYSLDLWQFQKWKRRLLPADTIDVVLGAALLCVNSCLGGRSSLLIAPFPSSMEARFPALYLEEEFLERASKTSHWAYAALHKFKRDIPITLLKRLASSVFQEGQVNIDAQARHHRRDFVILKLLSESDDPSIVCSFIQDTLKTPEGSSWHRLLLSAGLLRSLPPCTVQDVLLEFATNLFGTEEPDPGVQTASNPEARRPHVKVTTVKMLAQLLQVAPYASPGFSVELLGRILRGSKHIDIRAAALASLVDIGLATECDSVRDGVIEKLRQYAVPRASSVNEFRALSEEQWQEAERCGAVPEIWDSMEDPPVVSLLTKAAKAFKSRHASGGNSFMDVFMEAMQASGNVHLRWMEVFMAKHGFALGEDERLPAVPFRVKALNDAIPQFQASPEAFDTMRRHVLLNIKPPGLASITTSIKQDPKLSFTTAGKHWLSLWDKGVGAFFDFGGSWAIRQLARLTSGFEPDEVDMGVGDVAALESFMWEMVDVFLSEGQAAALTRMIQIYIDNTRWSKDMSAAESVLQRIVDKVDSMRTEDWQGDYDRKPRLLPSTFDIKLETLRMLYSLKDDRDSVPMDEEDRSRLATKTVALIRDMAANEMPYHIVFEKLKASLAREARSCIQVAVLIGSVDDLERPVISDYLRVDLAAAMLEQKTYFHGKVDKWDGHVVEVVKKMLDSWERSPIEYIRNAARPFGTEEDGRLA